MAEKIERMELDSDSKDKVHFYISLHSLDNISSFDLLCTSLYFSAAINGASGAVQCGATTDF